MKLVSNALIDQPTASPTNKVYAGMLTGALMTVLLYTLKAWKGIELPADVAVAVSTLISAGIMYATRDRVPAAMVAAEESDL